MLLGNSISAQVLLTKLFSRVWQETVIIKSYTYLKQIRGYTSMHFLTMWIKGLLPPTSRTSYTNIFPTNLCWPCRQFGVLEATKLINSFHWETFKNCWQWGLWIVLLRSPGHCFWKTHGQHHRHLYYTVVAAEVSVVEIIKPLQPSSAKWLFFCHCWSFKMANTCKMKCSIELKHFF